MSIKEAVKELNDKLEQETEFPFQIDIVNPENIKAVDKNARYMENETFQNLVENIKKDDGLGSTPRCWENPDTGELISLSGNHRVKAAIEAKQKEIIIIKQTGELDRDEQIAIQLSHNEITGKDDPGTLKELYQEIEEIEMKEYSGLDDTKIEELETTEIETLGNPALEFATVVFLFMPEEVERLEVITREALETVVAEEYYSAQKKEHRRFLKALDEIEQSHGIKNRATALTILLDIYEDNIGQLKEGWEKINKGSVSLTGALETRKITKSTAEKVDKCMEIMLAKKEIDKKEKHKALEILVDEYLK